MSSESPHGSDHGSAHSSAHSVPYVRIYWILVAALAVSLLLAFLDRPMLAAALIFAVAIVKAGLVAGYYMHLKFEPRYVILVMLAGLATLFVLFGGLLLDIVHVYGD